MIGKVIEPKKCSPLSGGDEKKEKKTFTFATLVNEYKLHKRTPVPWHAVQYAKPLREIPVTEFHTNNHRVDDTSKVLERQYEEWRIFHTLHAMCKQRGYFQASIPHHREILDHKTKIEYQKVPDLATFIRWQGLCEDPLDVFSQKWNPTKATRARVGAFIPQSIMVSHIKDCGSAPGIKDLRVFVQRVVELGQHVIMVVPTQLTDTFSREIRRLCKNNARLDLHLEIFNHLRLLSPLTEFDVVPPLQVIGSNEMKRILTEKHTVKKYLPQSLQWGPVPQYLGLRVGDTVKETIYTPSNTYPVIRQVVEDIEHVFNPLRDREIIPKTISAAAMKQAS